jgi:hypothetical protein
LENTLSSVTKVKISSDFNGYSSCQSFKFEISLKKVVIQKSMLTTAEKNLDRTDVKRRSNYFLQM